MFNLSLRPTLSSNKERMKKIALQCINIVGLAQSGQQIFAKCDNSDRTVSVASSMSWCLSATHRRGLVVIRV